MCESIENQVAWVTCDPLALGQGARGVCAPGAGAGAVGGSRGKAAALGTPSPESRAGLVPVAGSAPRLASAWQTGGQ